MQSKLIMLVMTVLAMGLLSCRSNPHKADEIETKINQAEDVGGGVVAGVNEKGEMVTQKKIKLGTYLRDLQSEVYTLETEIYGNVGTGSKGLYGALRDCRDKARLKEYGGDGKVSPPPQKNILTRSEDTSLTALIEKLKPGKIGTDEEKQLVAVSEDYLLERIKRFEKYKDEYQERREQLDEEMRKCQASIREKKPAAKVGEP